MSVLSSIAISYRKDWDVRSARTMSSLFMEIRLLRPRNRMRRFASDSRRKSPSPVSGTIFRWLKPTFSPLKTIPAQSSR
jgi:hypothetical protein